LDNVVDLILTCIDHPKAANQVFLVSDGEDVSTSLLLSKIAIAFDTKAWLMPIPGGVVKIIAKLIGKGSTVDRLYGSLRINNEKARHLLGWKSVITMDEQLSKLATHLKGNIDPQ
jgi:nucleoside-diphosphate-sugar epimerase